MRDYTEKLIDLIDDGIIDKDNLILNLLSYMSEDDVKDFCEYNGYCETIEEDNDE